MESPSSADVVAEVEDKTAARRMELELVRASCYYLIIYRVLRKLI